MPEITCFPQENYLENGMPLTRLPSLDVRVPTWDLSRLQPRECPVCGASTTDEAVQRPDSLVVRRCSDCCTYYVSPAPSAAALDTFYAAYLTHATGGAEPAMPPALKRNAEDDVRIQALLSKTHLCGAHVLDVGCGTGYMLEMLRSVGANASGIDVDPGSVEQAHRRGLDVQRVSIDAVPVDPGFDVVILNDVIEHPLEPIPFLRTALARVKPGGLLMIWTPNGDAPGTDQERVTFRVDLEHMQYLGAESMRRIVAELRLQVVHFESLGQPNVAPLVTASTPKRLLRDLAKRLPGFQFINRARRIYQNGRTLRRGNYHLFCILRRTS